MAIIYGNAQSDQELEQMLDLQRQNVLEAVQTEEIASQGFVTLRHDLDLLREMNHPHPHIVARDGEKIVGYALVMLRKFEEGLPLLAPMFERINIRSFKGHSLAKANYFIMGQVCVDRNYRGQGIFRGLYEEMRRQLSPHFQYMVTEAAHRNKRSVRAHLSVGCEILEEYASEIDGEKWVIFIWDWT